MPNSKIPSVGLGDTINLHRLRFNQLIDSIGDVSTITTTSKNVIGAINEHDAELGTITAGAMGTTAGTVSGAIAELDDRLDSINNTQLSTPLVWATDLRVLDSARVSNAFSVGGTSLFGGAATFNGAVTSNSLAVTTNATVTGDLAVNGGDLTTSGSAFNLLNTTATTVNFAGAATTVEIGAATGTTNINNNLDVDGDVNIDGGDLTVSTGTFNLANTTATTVNFAGAGTAVTIGATTGTTTIRNANTAITGDLAVNGGDITTSATTFNLLNTTATTLNIGGAATTVELGAATGTTSINNDLTVDGNTTLGNATSDTITTTARFASSLNPSVNNTYDLGTVSLQYRDIYVDGTGYIDNLSGDSATLAGNLRVYGYTNLDSATVNGDLAVTNNFVVGGQFTVAGELSLATQYVSLLEGTGNGTLNAGVSIYRGPVLDSAYLRWDEGNDYWVAGTSSTVSKIIRASDVDNSSIQSTGGTLAVKALGVTNAMLAGSIANSKLSNSTFTVAAATGTPDAVSLGETLTFAAGTGITTAVSANTITITANDVILGTQTTGNYVATVSGTANEIEVSGSGTETAAVTVRLPSSVILPGSLTIDNSVYDSNGVTITGNPYFIRATGSTADIILDADGGDVILRDAGTQFGALTNNAGNLIISSGTTQAVSLSGANATVNGTLTVSSTLNASSNVVISGNLTVNGTTTTVNTETVTINDNIIVLNNNEAGTPTQDAGVEIERGTSTNVSLLWNETTDRWMFTNNGSTYHNIPTTDEYIDSATSKFPTAYSWSNGTTAGPTGSLTGTNLTAISFPAIPTASAIQSGIVTTDAQTFAGTKTFNSTITGSITGNAGTVTNGVYTTGDQTIGGTKTFSSTISGSINGNAATVTNGVYTTGDQTIGGTKTFSSTISGSINGNAATASQVNNALTFNNGGAGAVSGTTFNGSAAQTISYNTVGAPSITGANASGTWNISISGNAATATSATSASSATTATTATQVANSLTFSDAGTGAVSGTTFTGAAARTISYNSVGAPSTGGTNATGTWNISISGNAATATSASSATTAGSVTNGVYTIGNQSIAGIKTFTNGTASTNNTTGSVVITGGLGVSGAINAGGDITAFATSDSRLKTNIENIPNALDKVMLLNGVTYNWNDTAKEIEHKDTNVKEVGIIAQEVNSVLPEIVTTRETGYMAVRYEKLVPLLIEAIKELKAEIEELKRGN